MMKKYKTYYLQRSIAKNFLFFFVAAFLFGCSKKNYSYLPQYQFKSKDGLPDYSNLSYWAAHPNKKNNSDSVPKPLRALFVKDSMVDVFFIHPTTLTDEKDVRWNADIDDATLNAKTDYSTILYQASVFNASCKIFAPRYRQAHIKCFYLPLPQMQPYFDIAYEDIKNAFVFYLQHFNNGHPIIIASHSQGTKHAVRLLKEFFDDKPLQKKLVCAYIIGLPIVENYFSTIPSCKDANATGCYVNWRTYKKGYIEPNFIAKEKFKVIVTNPLSWTSDTQLVSSSKNDGGVLLNFNKIIPHVVNATIYNNILWTSKPNIFLKFLYTKKNFHIGDINLFYINIRENVKERIGTFWKR